MRVAWTRAVLALVPPDPLCGHRVWIRGVHLAAGDRLSPRLKHFSNQQAEDIRQEIEWYLYPRVRRWTVYFVTIIVFLVIGAAVGVYEYGQQNRDFTKRVCQTSKNIRDPLQQYIGTSVKIENEERDLHLPLLEDPRIKPLLKQQDRAIHKLLQSLRTAQTQSCSGEPQ